MIENNLTDDGDPKNITNLFSRFNDTGDELIGDFPENIFSTTTVYPNFMNLTVMDNETDTLIKCNFSSATEQLSAIVLPILLTVCVVALCVNIIVIASVHWIRSPMTPNLKISLSLAAADACSSSVYGVFIVFDYLPFEVFSVLPLILEMGRLSGIVITVVHLLALGINHYIGILKPLHYNSIVTSKKVTAVIIILWVCPALTVILMSLAFDTEGTLLTVFPPKFMHTFSFRLTLTSLFFVPMLIMVVCYMHILFVVKKQQNRWNNLSRMGSTRFSGQVSRHSSGSQKVCREKRQLEGNIKAIYTTLLILGSCFLGWAPALLDYVIMCETGCYIDGQALHDFNCNRTTEVVLLRLFDNILVILKMLANPIIYSIRMREIKDGTYKMYLAILGFICPSRRDDLVTSGYYRPANANNSSANTGTIHLRVTSLRGSHISKNGLSREGSENTFL